MNFQKVTLGGCRVGFITFFTILPRNPIFRLDQTKSHILSSKRDTAGYYHINMGSSAKNRRSSARYVKFAPAAQLCEYQKGPKELTQEAEGEIWYRAQDYEEFRDHAKAASVDGMENGLDFYLSHSYGYTDEKSQEMLDHWTKQRDTLRGLERFVNRDYNDARLQLRSKTVRSVIHTQKKLNKEKENDYDRRTDAIREVATILSREATEFAFMMGSADQKAAFMLRKPTKKTPSRTHDKISSRRASNHSTISQGSDGTRTVCSTVPVHNDISSHKRSIRSPQLEIRKTSVTYGRNDIAVLNRRSQ